MTEYEALDLMMSLFSLMGENFSSYLTVTSGYLLVAYFVGSQLTKTQTVIFSTLFIFGAGFQVWAINSDQIAVSELLAHKATLSPLTPFQQGVAAHSYAFVWLMAAGILVSIYFMWSVRHAKEG